jgi:hypothetical protein
MPPAPGGEVSPEEAMALADEEAALREDVTGKTAPAPEKPYSVETIKGLITQFNETLDALGGQDFPDITWDPPHEGASKWDAPLPPEIYVPLVAMKETLAAVAEGEFAKKYEIKCEEAVNDTEVRKITGTLARMAKDKKLAEAMMAPLPAQPGAEPPPTPAPSQFSEEDQMLAESM